MLLNSRLPGVLRRGISARPQGLKPMVIEHISGGGRSYNTVGCASDLADETSDLTRNQKNMYPVFFVTCPKIFLPSFRGHTANKDLYEALLHARTIKVGDLPPTRSWVYRRGPWCRGARAGAT